MRAFINGEKLWMRQIDDEVFITGIYDDFARVDKKGCISALIGQLKRIPEPNQPHNVFQFLIKAAL